DKDLEKLSLMLEYFSLKNVSLEGASSLISGFSKNSIDFGIGYSPSQYFSTSFDYTLINYKLEQPKSKSYLFNLTFYPSDKFEVLTEYNNFDNINYWTVGVGYYWR
ncbi:MAG: hypothetical protein Q7K21_06235, partial [Elusimicrobiota bacterium]|nr:hypothetical protein [Elusimicrobiota bacterium]